MQESASLQSDSSVHFPPLGCGSGEEGDLPVRYFSGISAGVLVGKSFFCMRLLAARSPSKTWMEAWSLLLPILWTERRTLREKLKAWSKLSTEQEPRMGRASKVPRPAAVTQLTPSQQAN